MIANLTLRYETCKRKKNMVSNYAYVSILSGSVIADSLHIYK